MSKEKKSLAEKNAKVDPSKGNLGWKEIPIGGVVPSAGNSVNYQTGKWTPKETVWDPNICIKCNRCVDICPDSCMLLDKNNKMAGINKEHCKNCGLCVAVCPVKALSIKNLENNE